MTNYIHILDTGHVTCYLLKKRNLYHYSNQAWDHLNKRVKQYYLTKIQSGSHNKYSGDSITNALKCPHTLPLARWLQRVTVWNIGYGYQHFETKERNDQI